MSSANFNPHKQGEHVFNNIAGSFENAMISALKSETLLSYVLTKRFGALELREFPGTLSLIGRIQQDPILARARTVTAPATGIISDPNSKTFGHATVRLEHALAAAAASTGNWTWMKKPQSNSTFMHFDSIVTNFRSTGALILDANSAVDSLIDCAFDADAAESALKERISDTELTRRRETINAMRQHFPTLKQAGHSLVKEFFHELTLALERRINLAYKS